MTKCDNEENVGEISFSPPLYQQRYFKVLEVLSFIKPKKVVDFGCAECQLICLLKREDYVEELTGVDIDGSILESSKLKVYPLPCDYLYPRTRPLSVKLLQGSVLIPCNDFKDYDAVTCIELIEHLQASQLPSLKENIFGFIRPKVVIISTPNSDYNVVFPRRGRYRHWDHKFEWSQKEFTLWCHNICSAYGYTVDIDGVGESPPDMKNVGYCTQIGIFYRTASNRSSCTNRYCKTSCFEVVARTIYPFKTKQERRASDVLRTFKICMSNLTSSCIALLRHEGNRVTPATFTSTLISNFNNLHLSNDNSATPKKALFRKQRFQPAVDQFVDSGDDIMAKKMPTSSNKYGQQVCMGKRQPYREMYPLYYKLLDACHSCENALTVYEQFCDCEQDDTKVSFSNLSQVNGIQYTLKEQYISNLSFYNSELSFPVKVTYASDAEETFKQLVLYKKEHLVRIPLACLLQLEEMRNLNCSLDELRSVLGQESLYSYGITFCDAADSYVLADIECQEYESAYDDWLNESEHSSTHDASDNRAKYSTDSEWSSIDPSSGSDVSQKSTSGAVQTFQDWSEEDWDND